jgi:hypothetical protein
MKHLFLLVILFFNTGYLLGQTDTINSSCFTHADSVYSVISKMNMQSYVGKRVKEFLNDLQYKDYAIGYHEEPSLRLDHITISYNADIVFEIYFNCLEYVPRKSTTLDRPWKNDALIIFEEIGQIYLFNYKLKSYPYYIKKTKMKHK